MSASADTEVMTTNSAVIVVATTTTDATAEKINQAHRLAHTAKETAVEHAIRCGYLLIKQKDAMEHGEFRGWVEKNCEFSYRSARAYMQAARTADQNGSALPFSSLRSALEPPRVAQPSAAARLSRKDRKDLRMQSELREHHLALEAADKAVWKAERALRRAKEEAHKQRASARAALDVFREQQAQPASGSESA